jgi:cytoskeletal protein RodZ
MPTVAEQLRHAREAQKLTIYQIAETTKIRTDHIRALEEGNFDVFSAPVYIRGFVRSYATLLKLNVPQVMAALDAELGATTKFSEPPPLPGESRSPMDYFMLQLSKLDWRRTLIGLGVIVVLAGVIWGVIAWRYYRTRDPLANLKPGLYSPTQNVSGETLPLPAPRH